tara:strand:- start:971 stop:1150 length:180 start_codon:yes stop_codon:yes gene_type:complete
MSDEESNKDTGDSSSDAYKQYDLDYDPAWDDWYDSSEIENKKNKIKKSNRRSSKNRDEW